MTWNLDDLDNLLPADKAGTANGSTSFANVEPADVPTGLPMTIAERMAEEPGDDRSGQLYALVAAAAEAGYTSDQVAAMATKHKPSLSKYADPAAEAARCYEKVAGNGAAHARPSSPGAAGHVDLDQLVTKMREYLHITDAAHVAFAVAVAVSSRLDAGESLWGLIVGTPSSGKTETVRALDDVAHEHPDEITAPSLLSWSKGKEPRPVGILARIPSPALLTVADFSTVLATSDRGGRDQLFALLRRVYDGRAQRDLGNSPRPLEWTGRLTLLAAVTPMIDSFSSHNDALGPRWLYCRVAGQDMDTKRSTGRRSMRAGQLAEHRAEARALACALVDSAAQRVHAVELSDQAIIAIVDYAIVCCYGRAGVERSGYGRREILGMPIVEEPPRVAGQLGLLARSLLAMGFDERAALDLCRRCALDSMPQDRLAVLRALVHHGTSTVSTVARHAGCHRHVARFALEDLSSIGIVEWAGDESDTDDPDDGFTPRPWSLTGDDSQVVERVIREESAGQ